MIRWFLYLTLNQCKHIFPIMQLYYIFKPISRLARFIALKKSVINVIQPLIFFVCTLSPSRLFKNEKIIEYSNNLNQENGNQFDNLILLEWHLNCVRSFDRHSGLWGKHSGYGFTNYGAGGVISLRKKAVSVQENDFFLKKIDQHRFTSFPLSELAAFFKWSLLAFTSVNSFSIFLEYTSVDLCHWIF